MVRMPPPAGWRLAWRWRGPRCGGAPGKKRTRRQDGGGSGGQGGCGGWRGAGGEGGQVTSRFGAAAGAAIAQGAEPPPAAEAAAEPETEGRRLAHGPQLPGAGVSQADIDKLLADFD